MLLIYPDDPSDENRRQHRSGSDAVKLRMIGQAENSGDDDQGNVEYVFHFRKDDVKYFRNRLDDAVCRRQHQVRLHTEVDTHRRHRHGQAKQQTAQHDGKAEFRNEEIIEIRQNSEGKGQRDLQSIGQRHFLRENALDQDEQKITDYGRRS